MNYNATTSLMQTGGGNAATYWHLMTQVGEDGKPLSYLSSEEKYNFIKQMYDKNLIVPLVGDFGGPKTIRAIGDYVRNHGATVTAFYVSTVEPYLRRAGTQPNFCASVATLPGLVTSSRSCWLPAVSPPISIFSVPAGAWV